MRADWTASAPGRGKGKGKGNSYAVGKCKGKKATVKAGESKGCAGGEGTLGEEGLVGDRQYKMSVAYFYLGGWRIHVL